MQDAAQLPSIGVTDEGMDRYVALAADGIADLRSVDVFRVIESLSERNLDGVTRAAFAAWIVQKRPDLADEVANALTELEQADVAAMAAPPAAAQPEPTATDPQRAVDLAFLSGVVSGSADQANADMWDEALPERLESIIAAYPEDDEVNAAWSTAVIAYTDFMTKAASAEPVM